MPNKGYVSLLVLFSLNSCLFIVIIDQIGYKKSYNPMGLYTGLYSSCRIRDRNAYRIYERFLPFRFCSL